HYLPGYRPTLPGARRLQGGQRQTRSPNALSPIPSIRHVLRGYGTAYLRSILVLAFNIPIIGLLILPDLRHTQHSAATLLYVALVVLGYYALIPLLLMTVVFLASCLIRQVALFGSGLVLALVVYLLAVDTILYSIFKFHLDAFWIVHVFTDYDTMGVPVSALAAAVLILVVSLAFELWLFRLTRRVTRLRPAALLMLAAILLAYGFSQAMHAVAYEQDHSRIAALTPHLPQYHPLTWHRQVVRHGALLSWALDPAMSSVPRDSSGFRY